MDNNYVIFSKFLYFIYSLFIHLQIYTRYNLSVHRKKRYQLLICRVAKNLPVLDLLNHFTKSSTVAYKKNLVYRTWGRIRISSRTWGRIRGRTWCRTRGRTLGQTWGRNLGQTWGRTRGRTGGRIRGRTCGRIRGRT